MIKSVKKIFLAVLMLLILTAVFPFEAFAGESDFEPRISAPGRGNSYYNRTLNAFSKTGYGMPNCTAYAYGRIYEITGEAPLIKHGDASSWWFINKNNGYYEYGDEPQLGAIACWSNHVAVVEEINGDNITVSQSHWGGTYFDTDTLKAGKSRYGQKFYGFIYASASVVEKEEPVSYSYMLEIPAFEKAKPVNDGVYPVIQLDIDSGPDLIMNSRMLTNALTTV